MVNIDEMQLGFVPGGGTTGSIFIVRQLQGKYIAANKLRYFAVVDPRKAFDHVSRKVLWWALKEPQGCGVSCVLFKACNPMPRVVCRSIVSAIMSLAWEFMCIRTLSLAHCSSSWCWRRFHMSSAFVCRGSFSALTTCCSSQTPRRSVSPSSKHGRLVWKVKSSVSK